MISRLHKLYLDKVVPALKQEHGFTNPMAVPTITKIVLNVGYGKHIKDTKMQEAAVKTLERITGQKPVLTKAKKSISAFKLREGMTIGVKVTLRGERMWEFLDKLINVSLARVRDFHGVDPKGFGTSGNFTLGLKEHIVFPEIGSDEVENLHGLELSIVSTAPDRATAESLFRKLGFPFSNPNS